MHTNFGLTTPVHWFAVYSELLFFLVPYTPERGPKENKQKQQLENNLEERIKHLTNRYTDNPSEQIQNELQ